MPIAYVRTLDPVGEFSLVEIVTLSSGSPPQRPQPPGGGGEPPLGIWGPGQMPPGFWGGGMGPGVKPQPPLPGGPGGGGGGGGPVDPGYSPPWAQVPGEGGGGPGGGQGTTAIIIPLPPSDTPPPAGIPPDSTNVLIWMGPGTKPAQAWIAPYASTGPVTPPPAGTPPA